MRRGTRVGQAYVALTADGSGINKDIVDSVEEAGPGVEQAGEEHGKRYGDGVSSGFLDRMRDRVSKRFSGTMSAPLDSAGEDGGKSFADGFERHINNDDFADRIGRNVGGHVVDALNFAISREGGDNPLADLVDRWTQEAVSGNGGGGRNKRTLGDTISRMLGAGSRSNVLNLFGRTVGNLTGLITKVTAGAVSMFGTFQTGFNSAAQGASFFTKVLAGGGAVGTRVSLGFAKLAAMAPVAIAAIVAVGAALTIIVSIASALLGVVTALAATITSALVGALAVGAGAFGALGVAIGLTTLAFTSMTTAQSDALKSAFRPVKEAATGLGQILLRELVPSFQTYSRELQKALFLMVPLAQAMSGGLHKAFHAFTQSLSGPGMRMFFDSLAIYLPRIVVNLSTAFGQFLNGVTGTLAAIMPFVLRFAEYLSRVATDFARWASSANGQNSITDFVGRALSSLKSLWNFIKAVGGLISEVLFSKSGQNAGNSIFDDMARAVRKFTDYISKEDRLKNWFKMAKKFAESLGIAIKGIGKILEKLNNSKVIDVILLIARALETGFKWGGKVISVMEDIGGAIRSYVLGPVQALVDGFDRLLGRMDAVSNWQPPQFAPGMLSGGSALNQLLLGPMNGGSPIMGPVSPYILDPNFTGMSGGSGGIDWDALDDLVSSGNNALNNTYESAGGYVPDPTDKDKKKDKKKKEAWKNPFIDLANSILAQTPTLVQEIRKAAREAGKALRETLAEAYASFEDIIGETYTSFVGGITEATRSLDHSAVTATFDAMIEAARVAGNAAITQANADARAMVASARDTRAQIVGNAEAAVQSAALRLRNATTKREAKAATIELQTAQRALQVAQAKGDALVNEAFQSANRLVETVAATSDRIAWASGIVAAQGVYTYENAVRLVLGLRAETATLADYADARRWAADRLGEANEQLAAALTLRDNYGNQVSDAVRAFGSLMGAEAKTLNGVVQALTATDITDHLQDRLTKIKAFHENLRQLLALGLSSSAYKQIVDAGVETGSAFAEALVAGGQGSISEVNNLTGQIDSAADLLGDAAASQMYQAGVDAAQGLVDGLTSLSAQLDAAAYALGNSVALAVARALGIASPSKVLYGLMYEDVGDGMVGGLDAAGAKVGAAGARLAARVAVSPEVAAYQQQVQDAARVAGVSGNAERPPFVWNGDIVTPTEDPHAVTAEVLNELTGRL